jgi:hypothetical protein
MAEKAEKRVASAGSRAAGWERGASSALGRGCIGQARVFFWLRIALFGLLPKHKHATRVENCIRACKRVGIKFKEGIAEVQEHLG